MSIHSLFDFIQIDSQLKMISYIRSVSILYWWWIVLFYEILFYVFENRIGTERMYGILLKREKKQEHHTHSIIFNAYKW